MLLVMTSRRGLLVGVSVALAALSCTKPNYVECEDGSSCSYLPDGVCSTNSATGNQWCSAPDPTCPSGLRWGDLAVGDGLAGMCVEGSVDAAVADGPAIDAGSCSAADRIVFSTDRDGDFEIAVRDLANPGVQLLTTNVTDDTDPRWSPDGTRIAWLSRPLGVFEVFVMNADGSNPVNVSRGSGPAASSTEHVWSPDGTKLAFASSRSGNEEVYVVNADGTGLTNLTMDASSDRNPFWAPDGSRILFSSNRGGSYDIYVMNADGSSQMSLTTASGQDFDPQWSPGGPGIVFLSTRAGTNDLWRMNVDGSSETNLTPTPTYETAFAWSSSGAVIAYEFQVASGDIDILTMTPFGVNQTNITNNAARDRSPRWAPDESQIAFVTDRDGNDEVYRMQPDGNVLVNVSMDSATDQEPDWTQCPP
jgi:Tol biopolymer transport system component